MKNLRSYKLRISFYKIFKPKETDRPTFVISVFAKVSKIKNKRTKVKISVGMAFYMNMHGRFSKCLEITFIVKKVF